VPSAARADSAAKPVAAVAIAVLPFSDLSPAKDQEYLCEGMAEEIMNALVRIEGIRVASRTSAFRARQDGGDLAAIARALSVNHVLEGSVRTSGGRLRVTAQVTDVASGYQLWSERFDRDAADVFAVQDEIAAGVVDAVKAWLAPGSRTFESRPQVRNLEAYRSYLKGRHLRGKEHLDAALQLGNFLVALLDALAHDVEQLVALGRDSFGDEAAKPLVERRLYSVVGSCVGPIIPPRPRVFAVGTVGCGRCGQRALAEGPWTVIAVVRFSHVRPP